MPNPQLIVEAPAITPYQYGLAAAAQPADTSDPHWQLGVQYEPISTYETAIAAGACGTPPTIALPAGVGTVGGLPFSIYAGVDCKAIGYTEDYIMSRARAILQLGWQHAAEVALWTGGGVTGAAPVFNASGTPSEGTGLSLVNAIAVLEKYLGSNYLGQGFIHATRDVAAHAAFNHQVTERAGKLQTILGSQWVFGGGYDGTGPNDVAPATGHTWMYATGLITIRKDQPFINGGLAQALNRLNNAADVFVEQPTVLTVDGPIVAVNVDLTL